MNFKSIIITACALTSILSVKASNDEAVLWYQSPAKEWITAAPLGNGRIGAMIYGGIKQEKIVVSQFLRLKSEAKVLAGLSSL